ncbi:MAG TPA: response regulator transcription factor [Longimicrobiales bacterium]
MSQTRETRSDSRPLRIVIADDHAIVRSGLAGLIASAGDMEVVGEARNGEETIRVVCAAQPDVVVMDVSMPGLDGATATERIRREAPAVRVLALTMHDDRAHLMRMLEAGATGYVIKRSPGDELLRAIRSVGAGESYVDSVLAGAVLRDETPHGELLSAREEEVLRRTAWGESNKAIAAALGISIRTVETYKARITDKLDLRSRPEMVRYAVERGWMTSD